MRTFLPAPLYLALSLLASAPAFAQTAAHPVQQFQVRIVDVPRAEAIKALAVSALDGEGHVLDGATVSGLIESAAAVPVTSFGGSSSREIVIAEDETTIDFKISSGAASERGLPVSFEAEFETGEVTKVAKGSGVLAPGSVLVTAEDAGDPDVTRLTVLSIN